MVGLLRDRWVPVTGGSAGIGAAVAGAAIGAGARVSPLARKGGRPTEVADRLGSNAVPVTCDITDMDAVPGVVAEAVAGLGGLDVVVNSAGMFTVGGLSDTDPAAWRAMFEVNVLGLLAVTKAAVPHLRAGNSPSVVNISSTSGRRADAVVHVLGTPPEVNVVECTAMSVTQ